MSPSDNIAPSIFKSWDDVTIRQYCTKYIICTSWDDVTIRQYCTKYIIHLEIMSPSDYTAPSVFKSWGDFRLNQLNVFKYWGNVRRPSETRQHQMYSNLEVTSNVGLHLSLFYAKWRQYQMSPQTRRKRYNVTLNVTSDKNTSALIFQILMWRHIRREYTPSVIISNLN